MSTGILFGLPETQIETFAKALEVARADFDAVGSDERHKATLGRNLEGLIQHCQEIPRLLRLHCDNIKQMIPAHAIDDYEETGQELQRSFDRTREVLEGIQALAQRFLASGGSLKNTGTVKSVLAEAKSCETEFFAHWPRFEPGDAEAALQDYARGLCLDLDDAFAQIKGVSREVWLLQVAKHKAQKQK